MMKIIVEDGTSRVELFCYYSDARPEKSEYIGYFDELFKIVSVIHVIDEYGYFKEMKVLVTQNFNKFNVN